MTTDRISITQLPRALRELTGGDTPGYRTIYGMVIDGELPAEQIRGRWYVRRQNLTGIAEQLGLRAPATGVRRERTAEAMRAA